jgi:hypothetical protein
MNDALTGLVDIEHRDAIRGGLHPQSRQEFLADLDRPGPPARRGNGVVRRRKGQFRIMDAKTAAFEIEQATRPAEIVEQMTIDMEKIGITADFGDDVLVPDFGQQRPSGLFQGMSSLVASMAGGIHR